MADNHDPVPEAVRAELARLLDDPVFTRSPRLSQFLGFLVEEELAGRGARINGTQVAIEVYGRDETFDPSIDPVVRVEARRLRRALENYYANEGADNAVRIEIPKGGYRPVFIQTDSTGDPHEQDAGDITGQLENLPDPVDAPVIAILPFRNLGVGKDHEYFAEGFAGSLADALSRFDILQVIAPQSSARYLGRRVDVRIAGRELGARFILTGKVRISDNKLRLNVALSNVLDGAELWGEKFDRELQATELFHLEDELVQSVVAIVSDVNGMIPKTLTPEVQGKPAESLDVYEAVLVFLVYLNHFRREDFMPAWEAVQAAHRREPGNHLMLTGLSMLHSEDYFRGITGSADRAEQAWLLANRAVSVNPHAANTHLARAIAALARRRGDIAVEEAEIAISLNPNSASLCGMAAHAMGIAGELERGIRLLRDIEALNPYFPSWLLTLSCLSHYLRGDYLQALAVAEKFTLDDWPGKPLYLAIILGQLERRDEAERQLALLGELDPFFRREPREYVHRNFLIEEHIDAVTDGLVKAGLRFPDP